MSLSIAPLAEPHFEDLRCASGLIAREKRYLAFLQAPPFEQELAFYRYIETTSATLLRLKTISLSTGVTSFQPMVKLTSLSR